MSLNFETYNLPSSNIPISHISMGTVSIRFSMVEAWSVTQTQLQSVVQFLYRHSDNMVLNLTSVDGSTSLETVVHRDDMISIQYTHRVGEVPYQSTICSSYTENSHFLAQYLTSIMRYCTYWAIQDENDDETEETSDTVNPQSQPLTTSA